MGSHFLTYHVYRAIVEVGSTFGKNSINVLKMKQLLIFSLRCFQETQMIAHLHNNALLNGAEKFSQIVLMGFSFKWVQLSNVSPTFIQTIELL